MSQSLICTCQDVASRKRCVVEVVPVAHYLLGFPQNGSKQGHVTAIPPLRQAWLHACLPRVGDARNGPGNGCVCWSSHLQQNYTWKDQWGWVLFWANISWQFSPWPVTVSFMAGLFHSSLLSQCQVICNGRVFHRRASRRVSCFTPFWGKLGFKTRTEQKMLNNYAAGRMISRSCVPICCGFVVLFLLACVAASGVCLRYKAAFDDYAAFLAKYKGSRQI